MKRIARTEQINSRLRAAYGPDANLDGLVVYEAIALNTLPIRKAGGIFQGARNSLSLLSEIAAAINAESRPLQVQHDTSMVPAGRTFYAETLNDEVRSLFAIDGASHPDLVSKVDNGTIDQVSVNFAPKAIKCSACGYDFLAPGHELSLWTLTDEEGHTIGQNGVFAHVDGLKEFFELSLVGMGGAQGARIVGPTDARLQHNEQFRLAASANPSLVCVALSPTQKDPEDTMNAEQLAAFQAAVTGQATASAQLTAVTAERDAARAEVQTLTASVATLTAERDEARQTATAAQAHKDAHDVALAALTEEATTVLTALKKPTDNLPQDVPGLVALIKENRAAFAAIIPPGGATNQSDTQTQAPALSVAAFRAPPAR